MHSGRATLHELRTIYDLEDLYRLWEVDYVPLYNDYIEEKHRREQERLNDLARKFKL